MLVKFVNSSNIVVRDVTLADSAFWTFHLLNCRHAHLTSHNFTKGFSPL